MKYCIYCGQRLEGYELVCPNPACGKPIPGQASRKEEKVVEKSETIQKSNQKHKEEVHIHSESPEKQRRIIVPILLAIIIVLLILVLVIVLKQSNPDGTDLMNNNVETDQSAGTDTTVNYSAKEEPDSDSETINEENDYELNEEIAPEKLNTKLVDTLVNTSNTANYENNLNPDEYLTYASEDFSFSYPAYLYCNSIIDVDNYPEVDGNNVRTVELSGDDGISKALFRVSARTDNESGEYFMGQLYDYYSGQLNDMEKITYSDEKGRFIITGYEDSSKSDAVYLLVRVTEDQVKTMRIDFPFYGDKNSEDYIWKCYVVECIYRACSYGGSTTQPRSYQEFLLGQ